MIELEFARQQALNMFNNEWIEWTHIPKGLTHCPICLVLDECWFQHVENIKMPQLPQHEKCHCAAKKIATPIAGKTAIARCPLEKFTEYIFSDKYAWNGKRELFFELGFDMMDSKRLQTEFEKQAQEKYANGEYSLDKLDIQGQRINIKIIIERDGTTPVSFIAGWMVRKKGLITNNTPLGDN